MLRAARLSALLCAFLPGIGACAGFPLRAPDLSPAPAVEIPEIRSEKRGVGYWTPDDKKPWSMPAKTIDDMKAAWVYNWGPAGRNGEDGIKAGFVPMIWDEKDANPKAIGKIKAAGYDTLLGFNEPDNDGQADMTVGQAIELWPVLEKSGARLGSPAPAGHEEWLDEFMAGAKKRGYRVDFTCIHWYGDVIQPDAVNQLRDYCRRTWKKHGLPVWVTEYSGPNWAWHSGPATMEDNARFARDSCLVLDSLPFVERYAWFMLGAGARNGDDYAPTSLYLTLDKPAPAGIAYRDAYLRKDLGFKWRAYKGKWESLPELAALKPDAEGTCIGFDAGAPEFGERQEYAISFEGCLQVAEDGVYSFHLGTKDSSLSIGDELVVRHGIAERAPESSGSIGLKAGRHRFKVEYLGKFGGWWEGLKIWMSGPGQERQGIPLDSVFLP